VEHGVEKKVKESMIRGNKRERGGRLTSRRATGTSRQSWNTEPDFLKRIGNAELTDRRDKGKRSWAIVFRAAGSEKKISLGYHGKGSRSTKGKNKMH